MPIHYVWQWISVYKRGLTRLRPLVEVQHRDRRRKACSGLELGSVVSFALQQKPLRQRKPPEEAVVYHLWEAPSGRCLFGTRTCFKCRQEGHTTDRCPLRLTGTRIGEQVLHIEVGLCYQQAEAERRARWWQCASVLGHYALVLFDSGSSHSFISSAFVLHARLEVEPLHHVLSVSTLSGECMLSKEKVKACQIEIAGHVIEVFVSLDMLDFDVILGMDWLAANHASIDCSRKEVTFNPPSMASFKFKGGGSRSLPQVISAIRASKLLSQGTWGILASVLDTREVDVSLSSEPVVRDYPDVFPEELPGLPPHREVEFAIELEPARFHIQSP
ncbi:hypothetical protein IC575_011605 [Cucumis melo]